MKTQHIVLSLGIAAMACSTPALAQSTADDLLEVLGDVFNSSATAEPEQTNDGMTRLLFEQSSSSCRERLQRIWDSQRALATGWTMVGVASDVARQTRVYTVADPDGALWTVSIVAFDMCLVELSGEGHRSPADVWRVAPPALEPIGTNPVEYPW